MLQYATLLRPQGTQFAWISGLYNVTSRSLMKYTKREYYLFEALQKRLYFNENNKNRFLEACCRNNMR